MRKSTAYRPKSKREILLDQIDKGSSSKFKNKSNREVKVHMALKELTKDS